MFKSQSFGVEPEPRARDGLTVQRIGVDRISYGREVNPDLVRPASLKPYPEHRVGCGFCGLAQHLEVGYSDLADPCCHERRGLRVPSDRRVYGSRFRQSLYRPQLSDIRAAPAASRASSTKPE